MALFSDAFFEAIHSPEQFHAQKYYTDYLLTEHDIPHFHADFELGVCVDGEGLAEINGITQHFSVGDFFLALPFQIHKNVAINGTCLCKWIFFDYSDIIKISKNGTQLVETLSQVVAVYGVITKSFDETIYYLLSSLMDAVENTGLYTNEKITAYLSLLMIRLIELTPTSNLPKIQPIENREILVQMISTIDDYLSSSKQISVSELADVCGISIATCRRLFTSAMQISPKKYISRCAIKQAIHLLITTRMSIMEISQATGFNDISSFNRLFHSVVGSTPTEYRLQIK